MMEYVVWKVIIEDEITIDWKIVKSEESQIAFDILHYERQGWFTRIDTAFHYAIAFIDHDGEKFLPLLKKLRDSIT